MKTQEKRKTTGVIKCSLQNSPENVCFFFFFTKSCLLSFTHEEYNFYHVLSGFFLVFSKMKKKVKRLNTGEKSRTWITRVVAKIIYLFILWIHLFYLWDKKEKNRRKKMFILQNKKFYSFFSFLDKKFSPCLDFFHSVSCMKKNPNNFHVFSKM